jgi:Na+/proline symporter
MMRVVTVTFTILVTLYAVHSDASIFKMVENAYQVTLVSAFVPLTAGLFWKRATHQGALLSIFAGIAVWLATLIAGPEDPLVPAQLAGLIASFLGMLIGSLSPQRLHGRPAHPDEGHLLLHGHAAAQTHHAPPQ